MIDHIEFVLAECITALRRNGWMTVSAVTTAAVALMVLGGLGYAYMGLKVQLDTLPPMFELRFSVKDGTTRAQESQIAQTLRKADGVSKVVLLPKEVEWPKWLKAHNMPLGPQDIENPFPDRFFVTLTDLKKADTVRATIEATPLFAKEDGVEDAVPERRKTVALIEFVRWAGLVLGGITLFTAMTLILNAVHLTVLARRQELRIMGLVGATLGTIRRPLLLEGAIQGLAGGILAGLLLGGLAAYVSARSLQEMGPFLGNSGTFPTLRVTLFLALAGALMGTLAAAISVRKYLKLTS